MRHGRLLPALALFLAAAAAQADLPPRMEARLKSLWGEDALERLDPASLAALEHHFARFFTDDEDGDLASESLGPPPANRAGSSRGAASLASPVRSTFGSAAPAEPPVSHEILLQSRTFTPAPGVADALQAAPGGRHAIIQFWDIPAGGADWSVAGVTLLGYLPHRAYQAWIPAGALDQLHEHGDVRAVVPIEPADKIQARLRTAGASAYARNADGTVRLIVLAFADVDREQAAEALARHGRLTGASRRKNMFLMHAPEAGLGDLAAEDVVSWIQQAPPPNEEHLDQALPAVRGDHVQAAPYNLSGQDVTLAEWDGGWADGDHDDLLGRVTICDTGGSVHSHSTHVVGIMAGDGTLSGGDLRGLAPEADILTYTWPDLEDPDELDDETADALSRGALVSQNSWGLNVDADPPWENCDLHGDYTAWSQRYDEIVCGALGDRIVVVCSAGNEENDGDCPPYPWNQLTPPMATAKNSICVGAVYSDTYDHTCFSSRGPTDDGRLKPDLVAPGDQADDDPEPCLAADMIRATIPGDAYDEKAGTSMAAPMVSGTIALLRELADQLGYGDLRPQTYKALLIQTARDLWNDGPDYTYGHGLLDAFGAVKLLERDHPNHELIRTASATHMDTDIYSMSVPDGLDRLRVTLAWDDEAGTPGAALELVNDLGVYLESPAGAFYDPYVLDPDYPGLLATTGNNTRDNVEVVEVFDPEPGLWTVYVTGWNVPVGLQSYTLVLPYEHIMCGDNLYHDTTLGHDLGCPGDSLTLARDGITLDGAGHAITGPNASGSEGLRIMSANGVTVENVLVRLFDDGIYIYNADSCTIGGGNTIVSNTCGIAMGPGSDENVIAGNDIHGNHERGIELDFCYGNIIGGLGDIYDNKRSVMFTGDSFDNMVFWASIHDNTYYGVYASGAQTAGNEVNASIIENNQYGVRFWGIGLNNAIQSCEFHGNDDAIFIYDTEHLDIADCEITGNSAGVFLSATTEHIRLDNNVICDNAVDIEDEAANSGNNNRCASVIGWADEGQAQGCDWHCSGCRHPEDDLYVGQDLELCSGTYVISDEANNGVIRTSTSGLRVNGNGATIVGDGSGIGLRCDHNDVVVTDLHVEHYQMGIRLSGADRCSLTSCTATQCAANGVFVTNSDDNLLTDCESEGNSSYGYSVASSSGNQLVSCSATGNSRGYYLSSATGNSVRGAPASGNEYGAYLNNSQSNVFWDNQFLDNTVNAYENEGSTGNTWNMAIGNYWDDFAANPGFPYHYEIEGPGDGIDWRPVGAVIVVKPDGTGDYPTIQAALDAALENSIIVLTSGQFTGPGNRDLDCQGKALWIRSLADDPDSCLILCNGTAASPHRGFRFHSGEGDETVVQGVTIADGYRDSDGGGAIACLGDVRPLLLNCRFENNLAAGGGAVYCEGASPTFEDCWFESNWAADHGGAIQLRSGSSVTLTRTTFDFHEAGDLGGTILVSGTSTVTLDRCTVHEGNADQGGGLYVDGNGSHAELTQTIVGFSGSGGAVVVESGGSAHLSCCDLFGNAGGDWVGAIAGQYGVEGNIAEDPAYCDAAAGDFTLEETSPCAPFSPPNPACGQIGAWPVGCSGTSVVAEPTPAPAEIFLGACRPNPLTAGTRIDYGIPAGRAQRTVALKIYDAAGHRVRTLVDGPRPQGYHSARWRGEDDRGRPVAGGIYFYRLSVDDARMTRRLVLIR